MLENKTLENLRREYKSAPLNEKEALKDPLKQFEKWFEEAITAQIPEPNAMTLATATKAGIPSARIVLLKGFDVKGFRFYTNYLSRKGRELHRNTHASLVFFWPELERQIRIDGVVEKLSKEESEKYFQSRPHNSQIAAITSPQSQVIPNRKALESAWENYEKKYEGQVIPKPSHWGGYLVKPIAIEFWQGGPNRLHDRLHYVLMEKGKWKLERLAP
jgi:pyridoxamine 5'-phosphate oxidase